MRIKTVTNGVISITLSEATIEHEIRRGYLADDGIKLIESRRALVEQSEKSGVATFASDLDDPVLRMMRTFTWPTFTACIVAATNVELPITFETFRSMPGGILSDWADAVYELNPAWRPESHAEDVESPKAEMPTSSVEG